MRTVASMLWQIFAKAPVSLVAQAVLGWFHYLLASLLLWFAAIVVTPVVWGLIYWLDHRTGLEVLTDLLRIRIDWPPPPPNVMHWIEAFVVWTIAPFWVGTSIPRSLPGRELVVWLLTVLLWPAMAIYVPFTPPYLRIGVETLPLILAAMLAGMLWERSLIARRLEPVPGTR
jgi:hypothetical protein